MSEFNIEKFLKIITPLNVSSNIIVDGMKYKKRDLTLTFIEEDTIKSVSFLTVEDLCDFTMEDRNCHD